ncbi:hypothetical protein N658DRAFT_356887 [Parathielavia hyrcaniae]|uniref:Uncharacterized protein n=1 Tax=Parathielavia hyrcaniae TaxID=113614 RepID=A0AAN6Q3N5_9PEZI|nr:hypothetical protein N658DRAFT_356887 [Parathielavia hyrcaniae]
MAADAAPAPGETCEVIIREKVPTPAWRLCTPFTILSQSFCMMRAAERPRNVTPPPPGAGVRGFARCAGGAVGIPQWMSKERDPSDTGVRVNHSLASYAIETITPSPGCSQLVRWKWFDELGRGPAGCRWGRCGRCYMWRLDGRGCQVGISMEFR